MASISKSLQRDLQALRPRDIYADALRMAAEIMGQELLFPLYEEGGRDAVANVLPHRCEMETVRVEGHNVYQECRVCDGLSVTGPGIMYYPSTVAEPLRLAPSA